MSKKIVFHLPTEAAECCVLTPSSKWGGSLEELALIDVPKYRKFMLENETEAEALVRLGVNNLDDILPYEIIDSSQLPTGRAFRNAWQIGANGVETNMEKAREIQMNRIRELREKKLKNLDLDYIKADEEGNAQLKETIRETKLILRDITDPTSSLHNFDLNDATTPEELEQMIPLELQD